MSPQAETTQPEKPRGLRRVASFLWRWTKRLVILLVLLLVVARIALPFVLPKLLESFGEKHELELGYDDLDLSLLQGEVTLSRLVAQPMASEGETPEVLLRLDYLTLDVDISALLTGDLKVHRVELDGVRANLERKADGSWNFERHFPAQPNAEKPEEKKKPKTASAEDEALSLELPIELTALLVQDVRLHLIDRTIEPALDTEFEFDLRLADLGSLEHAAKLRASLRSREVLEVFRLEAEAVPAPGGALLAEIDLHLAGFHAEPLRGFLIPAGLIPIARSVDASLTARLAGVPNAVQDGVRGLRLGAELRDLRLSADGQEALGLDSLVLHAPRLSSRWTEIQDVSLSGLRARAATTFSGALQVAGFELAPAAPSTAPEKEPELAPEDEDLAPAHFALDRLSVGDVALSFFEGGKEVPFELLLPRLTVDDLLLAPDANPERSMRLALEAAAPGLLEAFSIEAEATPFAPERTVSLEIDATGVRPDLAKPYLDEAGIQSELENGRLRIALEAGLRMEDSGSLSAQAKLSDFAFTDGARELFGWNELRLVDFYHSPTEGLTRIGELEIGGPRLTAERDSNGVVHALGLVFAKAEDAEAQPTSAPKESPADAGTPAPAAPEQPATVEDSNPVAKEAEATPRFELGRFGWTDSVLEWKDASLAQPLELSFDDFGLVLENLSVGGEATGDAAGSTADLQLWFSEPSLARDLRLSGHINSMPGPLDIEVDLELVGQGLTTAAVAPYLEDAGIETLFEEANLNLGLDATVRAEGDDLAVEAALSELRFDAAERTWLSLDALRVTQLRLLGDGGLEAQEIALVAPHVEAERDSEGRLLVMGFRLPAPQKTAAAGEPQAQAAAPSPPSQVAPQRSETEDAASPRIAIQSLRLEDLEAGWRDRAVTPSVETALRINGGVSGLVLGGDSANEAEFDLRTAVDGALDELQLSGRVTLAGDDIQASINLDGRGLRAGPMASYLPPNLEVLLESGRLRSRFEASIVQAEEGGRAISLEMTETRYSDGEGDPFIALDRLLFAAPRIDAEGGRFDILELTTSGLRAEAKKTTEGLELLGIRLRSDSTPTDEASTPSTDATADDVAASAADSAATSDESLGRAPRRSPTLTALTSDLSALPTITLGTLDLGIDSFRFVDESSASVSAVPLEANLRLSTREPLTLLAPDPEDLPPIELDLVIGLDPIVREARIELLAAPWIPSAPMVQMNISARGIRGSGLTEVLPDLAEALDGSELNDGRLDMNLVATVKKRRRSPLDFDLAREGGFGLEVELEGPLLRTSEDSEPVLGLGGAYLNVQRIRPDTGDVHIRLLELSDPIAIVSKEAEGMRIAGLLLKTQPETEDTSEGADTEPSTEDESPVAETQPAKNEIRIDKLILNGANLEFTDQTVSPVMVLPIEGLEVEVKRFTTRALEEPRTFSYRVAAFGGKATMPEHFSGNLVGGLLATAATMVGAGSERALEERAIFDQLAVQGRLALFPSLKGSTKLDLSGLELLAFRGAANAAGIDLRDGVTDSKLDLRFRGENGLSIDSNTVFSQLSVTEPVGGPIQKFLRLPAPLDTVIFVLGNEDGEVVVPLELRMDGGGLSMTELTTQVTLTLTSVITTAIAGSALRVVGGVLDFAGLGEEEPLELDAADTVQLSFTPGAVDVGRAAWESVDGLVEMMRRDETIELTVTHAFTEADRIHAARLANPSSEEATQLVRRLRNRKQDLIVERDELALEARSLLAVGRSKEAANAAAQVRAIDTSLSTTETALDEILQLLRPGAERRADRRSRRFGIELANLRLADVQRRLEALPVRSIASRITLRRPRWDDAVEDASEGSGGRVTIVPQN